MDNIWWVLAALFLFWALLLIINFPEPKDLTEIEWLPLIQSGTVFTLIFFAVCFIIGHFI
jgi:hypothetical protein